MAREFTPEQQPGQISPELLAWAHGQFSHAEIVAGIHEVRETGGLELRDFINELENLAKDDANSR